jgi:hypothetical protein
MRICDNDVWKRLHVPNAVRQPAMMVNEGPGDCAEAVLPRRKFGAHIVCRAYQSSFSQRPAKDHELSQADRSGIFAYPSGIVRTKIYYSIDGKDSYSSRGEAGLHAGTWILELCCKLIPFVTLAALCENDRSIPAIPYVWRNRYRPRII